MAPIFCLLLCVTFTIVLLFTRTRPQEKRTRERLDTLLKVQSDAEEENAGLRLEVAPATNLSDRLTTRFRNYPSAQSLEKKLQHAGWKTSVGRFLLITAACAIGAATVTYLFVPTLPLVALALVEGVAANLGVLRWKCARRLKKFNDALPDSIELMSRALRAGHSMSSAIEVVSQQSPEPLGSAFAKCAQQQRFGIPFRDVLLTLNEQVPSQDLHFLVTAILVQKETGGDLTEILDRATNVIRERVRIQGEVRTHTAQGRLTGWILSGLPVSLLAVTSITSPAYTHVLFYDPLGQKLLYGAGGLIAVGAFIIRRIVDIKV